MTDWFHLLSEWLSRFASLLMEWTSQHPTWAGVIIFLTAFIESMFIVGAIIPGAIIMVGVGGLVGVGALELLPTIGWAIFGAAAGDWVSFWIGCRFKDTFRSVWPIKNHPQILERGQAFFLKHGGKSIALGRFVGPLRGTVPTVAGMMGMPPTRFMIVNILSAIAWAPAYILPGALLGASYTLISQVAPRLGIFFGVIIVVLWLVVQLVRWLFKFIQPRAASWMDRMLAWSEVHPRLGKPTAALLDPQRPEAVALTVLGMLLLFCAWLVLAAVLRILGGSYVPGVDETVYRVLQNWRAPWSDQLMVAFSQIGDVAVTVPLTIGVLIFFVWRRYWLAAAHWLAAVVFASVVTVLLKAWLQTPRPAELYEGLVSYAFPSSHSTITTVIFGFLAVVTAHALRKAWRWIPYVASSLVISLVAFSRLFLGAQWLSDVLGGLLIGVIWVALLGVAYRRHSRVVIPVTQIVAVVSALFVTACGWHISQHHARELARYTPQPIVKSMSQDNWWRGDWHTLPAYRSDLKGDQLNPLTVQWSGPLTEIQRELAARGWLQAPRFSLSKALLWFAPEPALDDLPVLPKIHNGRHEALRMFTCEHKDRRCLLLRLWSADATLQPNQPLWIGFASYLQLDRLPLITYGHADANYVRPLDDFASRISTLRVHAVSRAYGPGSVGDTAGAWDGRTLLIDSSAEVAELESPP